MIKYYLLAALLLGGFLGYSLKLNPAQEQVATKQTETREVSRTVTKTVKPDGTVVTKTADRSTNKYTDKSLKSTPITKPNYRLGAQTDLKLKPTYTAGRRLVGDLWIDGSYKPSTKDVTLGLSYEF